MNNAEWDLYFHNICKAVAFKSPCLSRQIGSILVRDKSIVATGYNGPPRGIPHCGLERFDLDERFSYMKSERSDFEKCCPRRVFEFGSGKGLELCTATHAEVNCIVNAARLGVSVLGTTMYMNCVVSCQECTKVLINAGVEELVVESMDHYDRGADFLLTHSNLRVRTFKRLEDLDGTIL